MARPPLIVVPPGASAEEVAAVVATLTALAEDQRAAAAAATCGDPGERLDAWVRAARLSGRRAGMTRGPWRLSARVSRRNRA
jgi:hypothetical protein